VQRLQIEPIGCLGGNELLCPAVHPGDRTNRPFSNSRPEKMAQRGSTPSAPVLRRQLWSGGVEIVHLFC
jgi:hypothetical protein